MRRTILTIPAMALALATIPAHATETFPTSSLKIRAKTQSGKLIAGTLRTLEDDQTGACSTKGAPPKGFPKGVKVKAKRYAMTVRISRPDAPKTVDLERQRRSLPPPPGGGIDGKPVPTTVTPLVEGGATTGQLVSFSTRVKGHVYLELRLTWPDPCDGGVDESATFGFHLRGA